MITKYTLWAIYERDGETADGHLYSDAELAELGLEHLRITDYRFARYRTAHERDGGYVLIDDNGGEWEVEEKHLMPPVYRDPVEQRWEEYAAEHLLGRTVVSVRYLTAEEAESLGWFCRCVVVILDDGSLFFPSADDEGNGPGALFGQAADGKAYTVPVIN